MASFGTQRGGPQPRTSGLARGSRPHSKPKDTAHQGASSLQISDLDRFSAIPRALRPGVVAIALMAAVGRRRRATPRLPDRFIGDSYADQHGQVETAVGIPIGDNRRAMLGPARPHHVTSDAQPGGDDDHCLCRRAGRAARDGRDHRPGYHPHHQRPPQPRFAASGDRGDHAAPSDRHAQCKLHARLLRRRGHGCGQRHVAHPDRRCDRRSDLRD